MDAKGKQEPIDRVRRVPSIASISAICSAFKIPPDAIYHVADCLVEMLETSIAGERS